MGIEDILKSPDVSAILLEYAQKHKPSMTAQEFMSNFRPQARLGYAIGLQLAKKLGVRSRTKDAFVLEYTPALALASIVCCLLKHGVSVSSIQEAGYRMALSGDVPSSPLHYEGLIAVELELCEKKTSVSFLVEYPGQAIAWGAGKRLIAAVRGDLESAAKRLRNCPSVISFR
jgi:hypothetical protein